MQIVPAATFAVSAPSTACFDQLGAFTCICLSPITHTARDLSLYISFLLQHVHHLHSPSRSAPNSNQHNLFSGSHWCPSPTITSTHADAGRPLVPVAREQLTSSLASSLSGVQGWMWPSARRNGWWAKHWPPSLMV